MKDQLKEIYSKGKINCLYCNNLLITQPSLSEKEEDYFKQKCKACHEFFYFVSTSFEFSCKDISVYYSEGSDTTFIIYKFIDRLNVPAIGQIPSFIPDFSNKEDLYLKIKTYLTFA